MERIKLEILIECKEYNGRLWVLELLVDDDRNFSIYRHYGAESDDKFIKRLEYVTDHFENGVVEFERILQKKLAKKEYRKFRNGEGSNSTGLLRIFRPDPMMRMQIPHDNYSDEPVEHRRLNL